MAQTDLFVQLLSTLPGRSSPDLPEGYVRFQVNAAEARGVDILQWCHPEVLGKANTVTNPEHQNVLSGKDLMAVGFEEFKAEVRRRAQQPRPLKTVEGNMALSSSFIFINADQVDMDVAKYISDFFSLHSLCVFLPLQDGPDRERDTDIADSILKCDAFFLVYGKATAWWVRKAGRNYQSLHRGRSQPPRLSAIYLAPPEHKDDLAFNLPNFRKIDARLTPGAALLRPLLEELKGA